MASVYTTKRGKTKKAKLGIRKDSKNNQANKLTQKIVVTNKQQPTFEAKNFALNYSMLESTDKGQPILSLPGQCGYPVCKVGKTQKSTTTDTKLFLCSACSAISYCSKECQRSHWPTHKTKCVQINSKKQETLSALNDAIKILQTKDDSSVKVDAKIEDLYAKDDPFDVIVQPTKESTTTTKSTSTTTTTTNNLVDTINKSLFIDDDDLEELEGIEEDEDDDSEEYEEDEE